MLTVAFAVMSLQAGDVMAQSLPGAADASRVPPPAVPDKREEIPAITPTTPQEAETDIPEEIRSITFHLKEVDLKGVSEIARDELQPLYAPYLDKMVTLDVLWIIANKITDYYHQRGYFLSRAVVPEQQIESGIATLRIVEGYIGKVSIDETLSKQPQVKRLIDDLTSSKPVSTDQLESFILRLNDLPGISTKSVLQPLSGGPEGAVKLAIESEEKPAYAAISFDNLGSRFLGPYQFGSVYQDSFFPMHESTIALTTSVPFNELHYGFASNRFAFYPAWNFLTSASYVTAEPGSTLAPSDIVSSSLELAVGFSYAPIRQRNENLDFFFGLEGKNSNGDIFRNTALTRDRIRLLHLKSQYNVADTWNGYNYFTVSVKRGIKALGARKKGETNLSRAEAEPDFINISYSYERHQSIATDFLLIGEVAGQHATKPLYSAEEFGLGGQRFGRAYDPSAITGDNGIAGSLELRYQGLDRYYYTQITPYAFYDIGKIWDEDSGSSHSSLASAGVGLKLVHDLRYIADIGVAYPLTLPAETPLYGNGKNPRYMMQFSYIF